MQVWTPHPYQEEAIQKIIQDEYRKEWFFPGEGKTSLSLDAFRRLKEQGTIKKALIIAPIKVMQDTWPNEIAKWDRFKDITYTILYGPKKEALLNEDTDIYLINFEGLKWLLDAKYTGTAKSKSTRQISGDSSNIVKLGVDMLIIDELSKCKDYGSMQTRLIIKMAHLFKKRIGLTATPSANSYMDLFGEAKCLDLGETLGTSKTRYQRTYFTQNPNTRKFDLLPGAKDAICARLAPIVSQRPQRQLDGLPKLTFTEVPIVLPPKARAFYNKMEKDFVAEFEDKKIDAFNAGVKTLRLRQVASGGVYYTSDDAKADALKEFIKTKRLPSSIDSRETILLHQEKTYALQSLIDGLNGQPLLVFYAFNHDVDNIRSVIKGVPCLNEIKGMVNILRDWNAGKIPVLLVHAKSAAHGLNLQESGGHICWYTLEWSHEIHEQAIGRVWRQGNPATDTRVYYLLAKNTVDEHVLATVREKGENERQLFDGVKKYYEYLKERTKNA